MGTSKVKGFSLIEVLAVLFLMAVVFGVAANLAIRSGSPLRKTAYAFAQVIQTAHNLAIKEGKIHRLLIDPPEYTYTVSEFLPPQPRPNDEGNDEASRKKLQEWEEKQKLIHSLSADERTQRTRLQRGEFIERKKSEFSEDVFIKTFLTPRLFDLGPQDEKKFEIFFYPSGETDPALIVLEYDQRQFSLVLDGLSGRVSITQEEISASDWKNDRKPKE